MNDIRLIALDLDRTLLNDQRELTRDNHDALVECVSRGMTIAICSGRDLPATRAITGSFDFPTWLLIQNGSLVLNPEGEAVRVNRMDIDRANRVLDVLERFALAPVVYDLHPRSEHVWWQEGAQTAPGVLDFRREHGSVIEMVADMRASLAGDISHMEVFGTQAAIFAAEEAFAGDADLVTIANISASRPDQAFMGIYPAGTSKEHALAELAHLLGLGPEHTLAIGDNLNDVGMVRWAGTGVMVSNGPERAREEADWIAPSNNESGVAVAIRRFALAV